jgi:hypothetical protein
MPSALRLTICLRKSAFGGLRKRCPLPASKKMNNGY